jgi:hypothetical protein
MIKFHLQQYLKNKATYIVSVPFCIKALHFAATTFLISMSILVWVLIAFLCLK